MCEAIEDFDDLSKLQGFTSTNPLEEVDISDGTIPGLTFGVSAGKFLGFIVHEKGIKIDPKKIEAIQSVNVPTCKKDLQKFLGKVNYLRRFICNLSGKVNAFTPLLRLKNDIDFTWGAKQQEAFDEIKSYLTSPPVLQAPKSGIPFKLYVAAEKDVIGGVLTQETEGKEYIVAYESRRLLDAKTRYTFIEKFVYHYIKLVPS
jgi:hypothetical protein